jgi:carotenoid cleavage dioxygenase
MAHKDIGGASSLDQIPILVDEEEWRILGMVDAENHNQRTVYNVRGYQPVSLELQHLPVTISGTLPPDLDGN